LNTVVVAERGQGVEILGGFGCNGVVLAEFLDDRWPLSFERATECGVGEGAVVCADRAVQDGLCVGGVLQPLGTVLRIAEGDDVGARVSDLTFDAPLQLFDEVVDCFLLFGAQRCEVGLGGRLLFRDRGLFALVAECAVSLDLADAGLEAVLGAGCSCAEVV